MGCASSKPQKQLEIGGDLYNKDGDTRRKLMTGLHTSKEPDGIETNFQIGLWKRTHKKYEKVASGHTKKEVKLETPLPAEQSQQSIESVSPEADV